MAMIMMMMAVVVVVLWIGGNRNPYSSAVFDFVNGLFTQKSVSNISCKYHSDMLEMSI